MLCCVAGPSVSGGGKEGIASTGAEGRNGNGTEWNGPIGRNVGVEEEGGGRGIRACLRWRICGWLDRRSEGSEIGGSKVVCWWVG